MNTKEIGDKGEQIAVDFLLGKGYQILDRNYRHQRGEIDIIGIYEATLVFVEVRYRSNALYGMPENTVDEKKKDLIIQAAEQYIFDQQWEGDIRFDILALSKEDIVHFEDAFF